MALRCLFSSSSWAAIPTATDSSDVVNNSAPNKALPIRPAALIRGPKTKPKVWAVGGRSRQISQIKDANLYFDAV